MDPRRRTWIAVLFALLLAQPSAALMIDSFNEGAINVLDVDPDGSPDVTAGENSGLSTSETIGGVRYTTARAFWQGTLMIAGQASVTSVPGPAGAAQMAALWRGNFAFFYDGIADNTANTTDGALGLDLSSDSAFAVDVLNVSAGDAQIRIAVWDSDSGFTSLAIPAASGTNIIDFSEFSGIDFSDVQSIRLAVIDVFGQGFIGPGGSPLPGVLTIDRFYTVPEPGTALLLSLGLVGLAARRRENR